MTDENIRPIKSLADITNAFYINLEHRKDRKEHVEREMKTMGIPVERFDAIKMSIGAIGCSMSHLQVLQNALNNNSDHVLIVEDDIQFLEPEIFKTNFNRFLEKHGNNWDVILLAGNNVGPYELVDETCIKVSSCQTTTGYLVNGHYIKKLLKNFKTGLDNFITNPTQPYLYAIDQFWFSLQKTDNWYLIIPPTVFQRENYSDIEKKVVNYKRDMVDLNKFYSSKEFKMRQQQIQYHKINKLNKTNEFRFKMY
jgi:glycosyl transferase family 25